VASSWFFILQLYEIRLHRVVGSVTVSASLQTKFAAAPIHLYDGQFPYAKENMGRTIAESSSLSNKKT